MHDDVEQIVWKHCLFNACKHDGKAEFKSVIGRVISERPDLKNQFQHIKNQIETVLKQVNDLKSDDQIIMLKNKFPDSYSNLVAPSVSVKKLPDLPNVSNSFHSPKSQSLSPVPISVPERVCFTPLMYNLFRLDAAFAF